MNINISVTNALDVSISQMNCLLTYTYLKELSVSKILRMKTHHKFKIVNCPFQRNNLQITNMAIHIHINYTILCMHASTQHS